MVKSALSRDTAVVAYDVDMANRLREILASEPGVVEKPMFGGLAFMVAGHMAVSAKPSRRSPAPRRSVPDRHPGH